MPRDRANQTKPSNNNLVETFGCDMEAASPLSPFPVSEIFANKARANF